ncbi:hypothetical protein PM082_003866 [Marasmius tenuissimus]|nr:hypothetical protein PM082_003866 [Marasmius tenuissimus]
MSRESPHNRTPVGLRWRAGAWYVTFVVWLGISVDLVVYSLVVPVLPFQLERLGYSDISSLTGWLLFSYSMGLAISTIPVAMLSERYNARKSPLVLGIILLIGAIIMMMEAPTYWLLALARCLQGIASTLVWVPGVGLLCDTVPERSFGKYLGIAMSGMSVGFLIGPPVGGALYQRFGFRGTCIFGVAAAVADLLVRLVVIERADAIKWGFDPQEDDRADRHVADTREEGREGDVERNGDADTANDAAPASPSTKKEDTSAKTPVHPPGLSKCQPESIVTEVQTPKSEGSTFTTAEQKQNNVSFVSVLKQLCSTPKAWTPVLCVLVDGIIMTALEPPLPVHMNEVWGFNSTKVGLIFIAAVVPSFISNALAGTLADRLGAAPVIFFGLVFSVPFWIALTFNILPLFIISYAVQFMFISGGFAPLTAELARESKGMDGVGYAHVSGAFNLAYGIGNAVGPIIGGQVFDNVSNGRGWSVLCYALVGMVALTGVMVFFGLGEESLFRKAVRIFRRRTGRE